jgi:hypothetical protein
MTTYISLRDEAQFGIAGAKKRMERAQQAVADFQLEHDGQVISPELRLSMERERHLLDVELDESQRQFAKSLKDAKTFPV